MKGDFWDIDNMRQFVAQVRSVDPNVTGNPVQITGLAANAAQLRARGHLRLAGDPAHGVFNFGTLGTTLLATFPLVLGMLQMFGLMGILDMSRSTRPT